MPFEQLLVNNAFILGLFFSSKNTNT